jgi:transcription antitermination factor NusG
MSWAVAQTYGSCERKAIDNLRRQGYEAFFPLFAHPSKSDISRTIESPLFPCYVFVQLEPQQPWHSINNTYGVIRLLTDRNRICPRPTLVPDEKIDEILFLAKAAIEPMPIGTHVRVRHRDSPFYDMSGTVVEMSKSMCVSVMMSIFNRDVVVEFTNPNELEVE